MHMQAKHAVQGNQVLVPLSVCHATGKWILDHHDLVYKVPGISQVLERPSSGRGLARRVVSSLHQSCSSLMVCPKLLLVSCHLILGCNHASTSAKAIPTGLSS